MKSEIVEFVKNLSESVFIDNLKLNEGLYVFIDLDNEGNLLSFEKAVFGKDGQMDEFFKVCLNIQSNIEPVSPAKIFNPNKKIFNASCSPFALCFKKKVLEENITKGTDIQKEIEQYFKGALPYIKTTIHSEWYNLFKKYCLSSVISQIKETEEYKSLKADKSVNLYLKSPKIEDFKVIYDEYVAKSIFNKDDYNETVDEIVYGIADSLSTFNDKKQFLKHKTAPFEFNLRLNSEEAKKVWQFFQLRQNVFPNPLPIFIDKKELNGKVISFYKEDSKIKYSQIINNIFTNTEHKYDSKNYYLIFFLKGEIADLDFISNIDFQLDDMKIYNLFELRKEPPVTEIKSVFDFEDTIANVIFNRQLITATKAGGVWTKYFGDIEFNPKYMTDNTYNQILKYRKAFFDYVYKFKKQAIQSFIFYDIMEKGILDDLRNDEYKDRNHSKEYPIREKLNIWFSLFNYFQNDKTENKIDMINKTELLKKRIYEIAKGEGDKPFIDSDDEFAFAAGQVIYKLLLQSESSNRSYAMLEPFLQKSDVNLFKEAIARTFEMYKHKFDIYPNKYEFDRVFSQVIGCSTDINIKSLLPLILAGCFSDSVFKKTLKS